MSPLALAFHHKDFGKLGWIFGRRTRLKEETRGLEGWFRYHFPRLPSNQRAKALAKWRIGFFNGFHGV